MEQWRPWNNYREALLHFHHERKIQNPQYSLRAYARDLDISASRLNGILKGKFGLSFEAAKAISKKLKLSHGDKWLFQYMVESEHGRSETSRLAAKAIVERAIKAPSLNVLRSEQLNGLLHWYTFAFLEMIQNPLCVNDISWIADRLGLDKNFLEKFINELISLKAISEKDGKLQCNSDFNYVSGEDNLEILNFHKELLIKTSHALNTEPNEKMSYHAWILSIDKEQVGNARKELHNFTMEFCRKFGRLGLPKSNDAFKNRDTVFALNTYLFPVAHLEDKVEK